MEQDALIAWGLAYTMHEFFLAQSDGTVVPFCRKCGLIATELALTEGSRRRGRRCNACARAAQRDGTHYVPDVAMTYISRATLLVFHTLMCMGIAIRPTF